MNLTKHHRDNIADAVNRLIRLAPDDEATLRQMETRLFAELHGSSTYPEYADEFCDKAAEILSASSDRTIELFRQGLHVVCSEEQQ